VKLEGSRTRAVNLNAKMLKANPSAQLKAILLANNVFSKLYKDYLCKKSFISTLYSLTCARTQFIRHSFMLALGFSVKQLEAFPCV
jgi:hypothetical protein